jgi:hypothetical protein
VRSWRCQRFREAPWCASVAAALPVTRQRLALVALVPVVLRQRALSELRLEGPGTTVEGVNGVSDPGGPEPEPGASSFAKQHELPPGSVDEGDLELIVAALNMQPALTATVLLTKAIQGRASFPINSEDELFSLFEARDVVSEIDFGNRTVSLEQAKEYIDSFHFPIESREQLMSSLVAVFEVERIRTLRDAAERGDS